MTVAKIGVGSDNNICSICRTAERYTDSISTMPLAMALPYALDFCGFPFNNSDVLDKGETFVDLIQLKPRDFVANLSSSL